MKMFWLLILAVFAAEKTTENDPNHEEIVGENNGGNSIFVKIEEDEYAKVNNKSKFIGVIYYKSNSKWCARRWSKKENKQVSNGYYDYEETAAHASDTLARKLMDSDERKYRLNFPDDYTEFYPEEKSSKYIGVSSHKYSSKWRVQRRSKYDNKQFSNGHYDDEETAAHASDNLARKLMDSGEQNHKLNFPDDNTEIYPEQKAATSKSFGVSYDKNTSKWRAQRWSKDENKPVSNGCYADEETTAHANDTLARKLMENGEQNHRLNSPESYTEVYPENKIFSSKFIGVSYHKKNSTWRVQRLSKHENKPVSNGCYADEEKAAHASDTLARKLMQTGEQNHKLNFPADFTEVYPEDKRFTSKFIGVTYDKTKSKWRVQRRSRNENTMVSNGYYDNEETAAHASDTLARKLMKNGELKLKLNFPDDHTEVYRQENQKERKRPRELSLEHLQNN